MLVVNWKNATEVKVFAIKHASHELKALAKQCNNRYINSDSSLETVDLVSLLEKFLTAFKPLDEKGVNCLYCEGFVVFSFTGRL